MYFLALLRVFLGITYLDMERPSRHHTKKEKGWLRFKKINTNYKTFRQNENIGARHFKMHQPLLKCSRKSH